MHPDWIPGGYRIKGYSHWYNIDLPEVMSVRKSLLNESGAITQIAMSAMDDWVSEISERDRPALVIIEGLLMYLEEEDVKRIFDNISECFSDVCVSAEIMNPIVVKHYKEKSIEKSNAEFTWGIENGKKLAHIVDGFSFSEEHSLAEGMASFMAIYKIIDKIPAIRNISNKIVVLTKHKK